MAVTETSDFYYDNLLNGNNNRGANNRIFDVVENNNNNKSKLLKKSWTDSVRELIAFKCNGNNRKYNNKWITLAIFVILLVPVYGDIINSSISKGKWINTKISILVMSISHNVLSSICFSNLINKNFIANKLLNF